MDEVRISKSARSYDGIDLGQFGTSRTRNELTGRAAGYANARNVSQSAIGKLATGAISLAAPFVGAFAADAFGRILPTSTPLVLREAAKLAVFTVTTAAVQAAAPYIGGAIGVAAGAAVSVGKAIVAVVIGIGVPKKVIFLFVFIVTTAAFQYARCRHRGRLRTLGTRILGATDI